MAEFTLIPIPTEDCIALGITAGAVLETQVIDDRTLVIGVVSSGDWEDLVCDSDCVNCPKNTHELRE